MNVVHGPPVVAGVGVILRRGNEVLLMRRKNVIGDGTWSTPGGHMDFGESPEECAIRETFEETGLHVSNPRFYALTNDYFPERNRHYITIWMEADYTSGTPAVTADYESDRVEWCPIDRLPEKLFSPFAKVIAGETIPIRSFLLHT